MFSKEDKTVDFCLFFHIFSVDFRSYFEKVNFIYCICKNPPCSDCAKRKIQIVHIAQKSHQKFYTFTNRKIRENSVVFAAFFPVFPDFSVRCLRVSMP